MNNSVSEFRSLKDMKVEGANSRSSHSRNINDSDYRSNNKISNENSSSNVNMRITYDERKSLGGNSYKGLSSTHEDTEKKCRKRRNPDLSENYREEVIYGIIDFITF